MGRGRTVSLKTLERRAKMLEWLKADPSMNINQLMKRAAKEFGVKLSFALCKDVYLEAHAKRNASAIDKANGNGHEITIKPTPPPTAITGNGNNSVSFVVHPSLAQDTIPVWKVRAWQEVNAALAELKG